MKSHLSFAAAVIAALIALPSLVAAGPASVEKNVAPAPPSEIDWAGPYIGFNVGAAWTHFDVSEYRTFVDLEEQFYEAVEIPGTFVSETDFLGRGRDATQTDAIGGGQLGYNLQFGHFVVGAEGGFSGIHSKTSGKSEGFQVNPLGFIGVIQLGEVIAETDFVGRRIAETNWNGYFGGQIGYAWWRMLFYGNGGLAITDLDVMAVDRARTDFFENIGTGQNISRNQLDGFGIFLGSATNTSSPTEGDVLTGWYAGGGAQYAVNDVVRVGIEYRHCDFGDETVNFQSGGPVFPGRTRFDLSSDQLTLRVNIMLGRLGNFGP
jgi:outer membrane immunogenic protein